MDQEELDRELAVYEKGRQLRAIVNTPAWEIVIDTLKAYRDEATERLLGLAPGDPVVPTAHAAASALVDQFSKFEQDIKNAVDFAAKPPEDFTDYLLEVRDKSDVLKAMELTNTPSAQGLRR